MPNDPPISQTTKFEFPGKLSGYTSPPLLPDHTKVTNPGLWQAVEEEKKRMNDPKTTKLTAAEIEEALKEIERKKIHSAAFNAILGALQDEDVYQPIRSTGMVLLYLQQAGLKIVRVSEDTEDGK